MGRCRSGEVKCGPMQLLRRWRTCRFISTASLFVCSRLAGWAGLGWLACLLACLAGGRRLNSTLRTTEALQPQQNNLQFAQQARRTINSSSSSSSGSSTETETETTPNHRQSKGRIEKEPIFPLLDPAPRPAIASIIAILPPQIPSLDLRQPWCQVWEIGRVCLPSAKICLAGLPEGPEDQSDNRVTYLPAQRVLPRYDSPLNLFASKHHRGNCSDRVWYESRLKGLFNIRCCGCTETFVIDRGVFPVNMRKIIWNIVLLR
jgi:hypothetical protein